MLVAVSDIHLGDSAANRSGFVDFVENFLKPNAGDITGLYLLGDIIDLWRRDPLVVISDSIDIMRTICSLGFDVYYIVGNHDFTIGETSGDIVFQNLLKAPDRSMTNMTFCFSQTATSGNKKFRFIHGHQIDYWYALPFYEVFCRAMCNTHESDEFSNNLWSLVKQLSITLSPIVASRVANMSESTQERIVRKLAGPLGGEIKRKEESAIIELDLLSRFIEFEGLIPKERVAEWRNSLRGEIRNFCDSARPLAPELACIDSLAEIEAEGSPEELVNGLLMTWRDINSSMYGHSNNKRIAGNHERVLLKIRRMAATLTAGLQPDEFLIHGHGHQSHVDKESREADTGCWLQKTGSFLTITKGRPMLFGWPEE